MINRKPQIGVIGTFSKHGLDKTLLDIAKTLGKELAKNNCVLMFGPEKDGDSLSAQAAVSARKNGGIAIGILYGSGGEPFVKNCADHLVYTGSERGGPRESVLMMSCDGVIAISGGSGTMSEMLIAYMNKAPVVVIKGTGGWSDKMAGKYFDHRKRAKALSTNNANQAVKLILKEIKKKKHI